MPKSINPLIALRRTSSAPFSTLKRKKPGISRSSSLAKEDHERLDDTGLIPSLAPPDAPQDVMSLVRYIQSHTFAEIPDRAAGMNSERISEVLRFRTSLPPIVSVAHLHALSRSSTATERELARLVAEGKVRKVSIPGRGKGGAAVGEGVVLAEDWKNRLDEETGISEELKAKYILLMNAHATAPTTSTAMLSNAEIRELVSVGVFTSPAALSSGLGNLFAPPGTGSLSGISASGFKAATGTQAAVGGYGAVQESGGGGSMLATKDTRPISSKGYERQMTFSLPSTGAYLKLLVATRQHLLALLKQLSPRYKEATLELLKEKWDGNTPNDAVSQAKRMRGEWSGVLPGKTRRWKEFFGMEFEWVLAESVGSGLIELFDTGSVGLAVRAT